MRAEAVRRLAAGAAVAVALGGCGGAAVVPGASTAVTATRGGAISPASPGGTTSSPASPRTNGFRTVRAAAARPAPRGRWLTARLRRPVVLRDAPGGRPLARVGPRTEFGSARVLGVVRRRGAWLSVLAPQLRDGRAGWVRAAAVRLGATDAWVRVDRSARRLELRSGHRRLRAFSVAVGRPGHQTPLGRFAVTDRLRTGQPDSPYGCCAVALTGHQRHLPPGWPGGDRIAIHATPATATIGTAASLGCLRAPAAGVRALMRRLPLGAPVFIRP